MTSLSFLLGIVVVFGVLLAYETSADPSQPRMQRFGLFSWLISGNWPAKVGAILLMMGIGALLRYAMINLEVLPELKLTGGLVLAAALGAVAFVLKDLPKRRAIHLALAGAAFGVAYLTAYSAYGFFNYVTSINALALLALVAAAAGVFAVSSNAMSVAILAMAGAYIAPKFALTEVGPVPVYGYYLVISTLSLVMVAMRGWRPLIHLSFLFTLAGGVFMGWTARFFQPEYYATMQPLIIGLAAVHLWMPLAERRHLPSTWLARFDTAYFLALPLVAAGLTLLLAPTLKQHASLGLLALAVLWAVTALGLKLMQRKGALNHALIAALLLAGAIRCYIHLMPWSLVALAMSIAALALAPRLNWSRNVEELACGAALLFSLIFVASSINTFEVEQLRFMWNEYFAQRMIASVLLGLGAWIALRRLIAIGSVLAIVSALFFTVTIGIELRRLNIDFVPQLVYSLMLCGLVITAFLGRKQPIPKWIPSLLILSLPLFGWWAVDDASAQFIYICFGLTPLCLLALALPRHADNDFGAVTALTMLPVALVPFTCAIGDIVPIQTWLFDAAVVVSGALLSAFAGQFWLARNRAWHGTIQPIMFRLVALALIIVTLGHIERGIWPVLFDILALLFLVRYTAVRHAAEPDGSTKYGTVSVIAAALVLQAMTLRLLGPAIPVMDASDLLRMKLPAVVSLMWACIGAGLTWWGAKSRSRAIWSAGAVLLVIAAAKLILLDSNGLGQLENILAMIAAGVVFMAVAWLAPIPPAEKAPARSPRPRARADDHAQTAQDSASAAASATQPTFSATQPMRQTSMADDNLGMPATANRAQATARARPVASSSEGTIWIWFIVLSLTIALAIPAIAWRKHVHKVAQMQSQSRSQSPSQMQSQQHTQLSKIEQQEREQTYGTSEPDPATRTRLAEEAASGVAQPAAASNVNNVCSQFAAQLPARYVIYAAGDYAGHQLDYRIDQSGHRAGRFDILVNRPNESIVLALGAYEPSIWNIRWTAGTNIVGVYVSGARRQAVVGLPPETPMLNASDDNHSVCEHFHLSRNSVTQTDYAIRKTLGRAAQSYTIAADGHIEIGSLAPSDSAYKQSSAVTEQSIKDRYN